MLPVAVRKLVLARAKSAFALSKTGIHGPAHWARVRANGLRLAKQTGADTTVVELFALLHDSQRFNEGHDPEHGQRAALNIVDNAGWYITNAGLDGDQLTALLIACSCHSLGATTIGNAALLNTVLTCWDADRLDLGRIGIRPDPDLLCTDAARDPAMIKWAYERSIR